MGRPCASGSFRESTKWALLGITHGNERPLDFRDGDFSAAHPRAQDLDAVLADGSLLRFGNPATTD
ncbi:MAG: hypothetical protein IPM82_28315 [Saprospiraceae bacterium]|nr:hypothetical protein [Saprospiraceae bacterium]